MFEGWLPWREATERALYGPGGFYHRPEGGPGSHYRTASTATPHFARAVLRLAALVDEALGRPTTVDLVEVGAARGALLAAIHALAPEVAPGLAPRLRLTGVDLAARPDLLPAGAGWVRSVAELAATTGLLFANEWLDNVPVDVVEQTAGGPRLVEVNATGAERLGDPPDAADAAWLARWWPGMAEGDRAEIGRPRDEAWSAAVRRVARGVAVTADYAHDRAERAAGGHAGGTLTGYRAGRQVLAVPDGSCDITAHVALDAVAAAGADAGATGTVLVDQRRALRALGVTGERPDRTQATADPQGWLRALAAAGEQAELLARGGLGDFGWLLQSVGLPAARVLAPLSTD